MLITDSVSLKELRIIDPQNLKKEKYVTARKDYSDIW